MFCLILTFALAGAVYADTHCVTDPEAAFINTTVTDVSNTLTLMLSTPATSDEVIAVLNLVCDQSQSAYAGLVQIDALVANCADLINATNLPTLQVGDLVVADLISTFGNVSNFCGCLSSLTGVIAIDGYNDLSALTVTNGSLAYNGVLDFTVWCSSPSLSIVINLHDTIDTIYNNRQTCAVFPYSTLVTSNNVEIFENMVTACPADLTDIAASFSCVLDVSAQSGFINCIDAAPTTCARRDCVTSYMNTVCSETMATVYMYVVEAIHTGSISLEACDSAGSVTASITLMLIATICSLFL